MPAPILEFWYDFASTYSYVAALRIAGLADKAGVAVSWQPFLLGPIFKAQGLTDSPFVLFPDKGQYMIRDLTRLCDEIGTPFRLPTPFPQNSLLASRVALVAFDEGFGEDFSRAVYKAEFGKGLAISEPSTLDGILRALGKPADSIMTRAQSDDIKQRLRDQTEAAQTKKIFGAPSFITADGELFWGNDRLEQALAWAMRTMTT